MRRPGMLLGIILLTVILLFGSRNTIAEAQGTGGPSQPIQVDFSGLTVEVYKSAQQQQLVSSSNPAKIYDTNNPEGVASQLLVKFKGVKLKNVSGNTLTCTPTIIAKIASDNSPTKVQVGSNLGTNITMAGIPNGGSVEIPANSLSYIPYKGGLRSVTTSEVLMAKSGGAGGKLEITVGNITGCGGSNFTTKAPSDNILWPALRAKVTHNVNGQQVPFANTQIKICRPNAAGLCGAGSPDLGISHFTDSNGYIALALGQAPSGNTTYAITTAAANGQPARSLGTKTLDDFKHYEIEVSTDSPPDLALDLSSAYGVVGGQQQTPVILSKDYKDITVKNMIVKNIGAGASPATTLEIGNNCGERVVVTVPAIAGGSQVALEATFPSTLLKKWDLELLCYFDEDGTGVHKMLRGLLDQVEGEATGALTNNDASKQDFFTYATLEVEVKDQNGTAMEDAFVTLIDKKDRQSIKTNTDNIGAIKLGALRIPGNYTISISFRGQSNLATKDIQITQPTHYKEVVTISPRSSALFRVNIKAPEEFSGVLALTFPEFRTGGQTKLVVKTDKNKTITVTGDAKGASIPRIEFGDASTFHIESIALKITFDTSITKNENVTWSVVPLAEEHTYTITDFFDSDSYPEQQIEAELETKCQPLVTGSIEICIHEDPAGMIEAQKLVPIFAAELARLQSFADPVKLTATKKILFMPYLLGAGMFDRHEPDRIYLSRYAKGSTLIAKDLVIHEAMHVIDYQLASASSESYSIENPTYLASTNITQGGHSLMSKSTGAWAWKNLGHTCALFPSGTKCAGHADPQDGAPEIFAEQITNVCLGLPVSQRLASASNIWREKNPGNTEPADLVAHRDVIASRGTGAASAPGIGSVIRKVNSLLPLSVATDNLSPVQQLIQECQRTAPK